ncbi:MAG: Carbohydrate binding family 6 [Gemmatimonadetes bacterium]|nr:Carbohydrate binding family 6 [Gemmatimonadota bacterium]
MRQLRPFAALAILAVAVACQDTGVGPRADDAPGPKATASLLPVRWNIFTTQTPTTTLSASPGWEVATRFKTSVAGCIVRVRFYRAAGETGTNTVKLWSNSGTLLFSETFSSPTQGWNYVELREHGFGPYSDLSICIPANTYFRVSVNTNTYQVKTPGGLASPIVNGPLTADLSYYGQPTGSMPTTSSTSTYFVDVYFEADS